MLLAGKTLNAKDRIMQKKTEDYRTLQHWAEIKFYTRVKGLGTGIIALFSHWWIQMIQKKKAQYIHRGEILNSCFIVFTVFLDTSSQENLGIGAKMMQ